MTKANFGNLLGVFAVFFLAGSCAGVANAGLPPTSLGGLAGAKKTTFNFKTPLNQATQISGTTSLIETGNENRLVNPGFENTANPTNGYSLSGGSGTYPGTGRTHNSYDWDASASAQTFTSTAQTLPVGDNYASCYFKCSSGTCAHEIQAYDGTNVLATQAIVSSTTQFVQSGVTFPLSAATSVSLRIKSNADEPSVALDDCYMGPNPRLAQVSQATLVGTLSYASTAGCTWSTTSTSLANYAADTDCPTPTVTGGVSAPGTKIPGVVVNSVKPGNYYFVTTSKFTANTSGVSASMNWRYHDGVTNFGDTSATAFIAATPNVAHANVLVGQKSFTSAQSNLTVQIQGQTSNASNDALIVNSAVDTSALTIQVYYFPDTPQTVSALDQLGTSWSGYHGGDCSWSRSSSGYANPGADATCTFTELQNRNFGTVISYDSGGNKLPGIAFTPKKAGAAYYVCAAAHVTGNTNNENVSFRLTDGTNVIAEAFARSSVISANSWQRPSLCGLYVAPSTASATLRIELNPQSGTANIDSNNVTRAIDWTIFDLSSLGAVSFRGVPVSSEDLPRIESAYITFPAGTPTITRQSGDWIASLTDNGTGDTTLNLTSGKFSAAPVCVCTLLEGASDEVCHLVADPTTSAVRFVTRDGGTGAARDNQYFYVMCSGKR